MIFKNRFLLPAIALSLTGCAQFPADTNERLGQFTAASSFNVRHLDYEKDTNTVSYTKGKACYRVNPHTLAYISGPKDNLMQRAMDDAIRTGQQQGIDGDLLVNTRIERITEYEEGSFFLAPKKRFECLVVQGDLVRLKK